MTNPDYTHVVLIVDRSSSMSENGKAAEATNGIKMFMDEQFALPGKFTFTLSEFDTSFDTVCRVASEKMDYVLSPRGSTALLDSVAREISLTGFDLESMAEKDRPANVIVVTVTDGEENSSTLNTLDEVKEMIAHQQDVYGWKFVFLGADTAAWMGKALGTYSTTTYDNDASGTHAVYAASSTNITNIRSGMTDDKMPDKV